MSSANRSAPPSPAIPVSEIDGAYVVPISRYEDDRGFFAETFRLSWFPQVSWERLQNNRSESRAGVLRGLHFHRHQVDYWYVARGLIRVGLADLRASSSTYRGTLTLELGEGGQNYGLFIPTGVAHGFLALTDATLTYVVNQYYDGSDEYGVAWDDPDLAVAWAVQSPILSSRDIANPLLKDIPPENLPR